MEKITCLFCGVFINFVICFGQSQRTIIPIKEHLIDMDSSFDELNFGDFMLYCTPTGPYELPLNNLTDSSIAVLQVGLYVKKAARYDYIKIVSAEIMHLDEHLTLSKKDSMKILNTTLKLFKKRSYYIKYYVENIQEWIYYVMIPVNLIPRRTIYARHPNI